MSQSRSSTVQLIKIGLLTVLFIVLIFTAAAILMVNLLNPNQFKNQMSAYVQKTTGRELVLAGDIHWSFFPWLGLKLNQMSLGNTPDFNQADFVKIGEADIRVRLMPLFAGKIEVGALTLKNVTLNLIKNAKGNNNWSTLNHTSNSLDKSAAVASTPENTIPIPQSGYNSDNKLPNLAISKINISNAVINWIDQASGQRSAIKIISASSHGMKFGSSFPINLVMEILNDQPASLIKVNLATQAIINPQLQQYALHQLKMTGDYFDPKYPGGKIPLSLQTNVDVDLAQQTLQAPQITLSAAGIVADGHILGRKIMQAPVWQGQWQIDKLNYANLNIKNMNARFSAKNNIININPLTADLYQGKSLGVIVLNMQNKATQINLNEVMTNIQVGQLFNDLAKNSKIKITGTGNLKMHIETRGANAQIMTQNLKGNTNFAITNGVIKNIDIGQQVMAAITHLFNQGSMSNSDAQTLKTHFSSLTGTIQFNNGVATNNDLLLQSPSLKLTGKGTANLVSQAIDYQLQAIALGAPFGQNILNLQQQVGGSIPIKITGSFSDPDISPDYSKMAVNTFQNKIKDNKITQQIQQQIEKKIGGNLGETINNIKGLLGN